MLNNQTVQQLVADAEENCRKKIEEAMKACRRFPGMWESEKESYLKDFFWESMDELRYQIGKLIEESDKIAPLIWNGQDWEQIKSRLADVCGLRKEIHQYHPVDLGFDRIDSNFCIWSNALGDLQALFEDPDPIGKTFQLTLKLKHGDSFTIVPYTFDLRQKYAGTVIGPQWEGFIHFEGYSRFPGYNGGCSIFIKRNGDEWTSTLFQKVYVNTEDPIWNRRKEELADWVVYVLKDDSE